MAAADKRRRKRGTGSHSCVFISLTYHRSAPASPKRVTIEGIKSAAVRRGRDVLLKSAKNAPQSSNALEFKPDHCRFMAHVSDRSQNSCQMPPALLREEVRRRAEGSFDFHLICFCCLSGFCQRCVLARACTLKGRWGPFLIKHVHRQQTLDLCTAEGRWWQKTAA